MTHRSRPDLAEIRNASIRAVMAPLGMNLAAFREQVAVEAEIESLTVQIAMVSQDQLESITSEVDRRALMFAEIRQSSVHAGEHPRIAALKSVLNDAVNGRLT